MTPEIRDLVDNQQKELKYLPFPEELNGGVFMMDNIAQFASLQTNTRKLIIKFLIETDELLDKLS